MKRLHLLFKNSSINILTFWGIQTKFKWLKMIGRELSLFSTSNSLEYVFIVKTIKIWL